MVSAFLDEIKKGREYSNKILVPGMSVNEVGQEVALASLFLSLKNPGFDPGVGLLSSSPGG